MQAWQPVLKNDSITKSVFKWNDLFTFSGLRRFPKYASQIAIPCSNYLCCITNYPKFSSIKQQLCYCAYGFYGSGIWKEHSGKALPYPMISGTSIRRPKWLGLEQWGLEDPLSRLHLHLLVWLPLPAAWASSQHGSLGKAELLTRDRELQNVTIPFNQGEAAWHCMT